MQCDALTASIRRIIEKECRLSARLLILDGQSESIVFDAPADGPIGAFAPIVRDNAPRRVRFAEVIILPSGSARLHVTIFDTERAERQTATIVRIVGEAPLIDELSIPSPIALPRQLVPLQFAMRTSFH